MNSKIYDGNHSVPLNLNSINLSGVFPGDDVNIVLNNFTACFSDKNAGLNKPVTLSGVILTGADADNYNLDGLFELTGNITPLPIMVKATGRNKVYDGTQNAEVTLDSRDILSGDAVYFTNTSAVYIDKNVGIEKSILVSGISASGDDSDNYVLNNTTAMTGADIVPAFLTVTAVNEVITRGSPIPSFQVKYQGFVNGENEANLTTIASISTPANTNSVAGSYPVMVSDASSSNYTITFVNGLLTINPEI